MIPWRSRCCWSCWAIWPTGASWTWATVEDYFVFVQQAGFVVERLRESRPRRELFADEETYLRRMRIPLFLLLAAHKP